MKVEISIGYVWLTLLGFVLSGSVMAMGPHRVLGASRTTGMAKPKPGLLVGAERLDVWLPHLKGKRFSLCVNQTSMVGAVHLLDTLLALGYRPEQVFGPEHGFRGDADAGAHVKSEIDQRTGIKLTSLYGKHQKPTAEELQTTDVVVFDIQDVGARFYTYISTMHYLMEACAENNKELIVLDRPNPMGWAVDGPVLKDTTLRSFVGMHSLPILHGLTVGELATMINGEGWLRGGLKCQLRVIKVGGDYSHQTGYNLPIPPSPNLPNMQAIRLYASLCLFEGTPISVGRGTPFPFQVWGGPDEAYGKFGFVPKGTANAPKPLNVDQPCWGEDLRQESLPRNKGLSLAWVIRAYQRCPEGKKAAFFKPFFNKLAGTKELAKQIEAGYTEGQIRQSWQADLNEYLLLRKRYLLYPE